MGTRLQRLVFGGIWLFWGVVCLNSGYTQAFVEVQRVVAGFPVPVQDMVRAGFWLVSQAGNTALLVPVLVWTCVPNRRVLNSLLLVWLACGVLTQVLKHTFFSGWPRPGVLFAHEPWFYMHAVEKALAHSMPSGHALAYAALAGTAVLTGRVQGVHGWLLGGLGLAVGVSRVVLGVHYPADVWVGWTLGVGLAVGIGVFPQHRFHAVLSRIPGVILRIALLLVFVVACVSLISRYFAVAG
jgi:membrane-associated phospholipid phosphatase